MKNLANCTRLLFFGLAAGSALLLAPLSGMAQSADSSMLNRSESVQMERYDLLFYQTPIDPLELGTPTSQFLYYLATWTINRYRYDYAPIGRIVSNPTYYRSTTSRARFGAQVMYFPPTRVQIGWRNSGLGASLGVKIR